LTTSTKENALNWRYESLRTHIWRITKDNEETETQGKRIQNAEHRILSHVCVPPETLSNSGVTSSKA